MFWLGTKKNIFSSPEPKAEGELIVWDSSLRPSALSNVNTSETSWLIIIKFHQGHHYCIRFWARSDQNSGFHGNR